MRMTVGDSVIDTKRDNFIEYFNRDGGTVWLNHTRNDEVYLVIHYDETGTDAIALIPDPAPVPLLKQLVDIGVEEHEAENKLCIQYVPDWNWGIEYKAIKEDTALEELKEKLKYLEDRQ